jgi:hypothetical protein
MPRAIGSATFLESGYSNRRFNRSLPLPMDSARYKYNNHCKHDGKKRRSCDVIQESARTTVSQKNAAARMTGHSNYMLIDFHSLTPEA